MARWEACQLIFLLHSRELSASFAFVTFKGPKAARFGFYLLLFPPCFTHGIAVPAGQPAALGGAESPSGQGPIRTGTHRDRDPSRLTPGPGKIPSGDRSILVAALLPAASRPEEFLLPLLAPAPAPASPLCQTRLLQPWHRGHSHQLRCQRSWGYGVTRLLDTPLAAPCLDLTTGFMAQSLHDLFPQGQFLCSSPGMRAQTLLGAPCPTRAPRHHHSDACRASSTFLQSARKTGPSSSSGRVRAQEGTGSQAFHFVAFPFFFKVFFWHQRQARQQGLQCPPLL